MRLYQKVLAILAIVISLCQNIHASTCDSTSLALMEQAWREFRAIHPFGFQTVGLKHKGDTCIFVISEPAEWVKTEDLVALFTKHDGHLIECIQPYGYDGELHDFVGCLRKDSINSQLFRSELFKLLYFTDYKAYYTDLDYPVRHIYFSNTQLNYEVGIHNLLSLEGSELFKISENKYTTLNNLYKLKNGCNKLYFSKKRGFVAWVVDSIGILKTDSVFLKTARKFALDTDIVLGSIFEDGKVAIIGREREVSVNILPPLRSETIRQLLTCNNRPQARLSIKRMGLIDNPYNLAFSNHPWLVFNSFETDTIRHDTCYAPVSMNKNVRNTELGNLMYLTDIILKSWCENGKVKDLFINYPLPPSYPYPNGVTHELGDSLRLHWRMSDLIGPYKTGCCFPQVSSSTIRDSIQNDKGIRVSSSLYSYFAGQQCIDLVRIKQYSILLDAFRFLTVGQSELQGTSRQKTPSITVSNKKWLYGGYLLQGKITKQVVKAVTKKGRNGVLTRRVPPVPKSAVPTRRVPLVTKSAVPTGGDPQVPGTGVTTGGDPQVPGTGVTTGAGLVGMQGVRLVVPKIPSLNYMSSRLRKDVIHPQHSDTERGFDLKIHNTHSADLLLSDSEKQDLLDKSDMEKKMMEDLRLQLRQFKIPVKVIQNEQRIIIHAINILNNYDKGFEYEWAA